MEPDNNEMVEWKDVANKVEKEDSAAQKVMQSAPVQAAMGYVQMHPIPRTYNLAATAANLINKPLPPEAKFPFLGEEANKRVQETRAEETVPNIPTTYDALKSLGEFVGVDIEPKGFIGKAARTAGELTQGVPIQGGKEAAQVIGGAVAGGLSEQALTEAGVPEWLAGPIAAIFGGIAQKGKIGPRKLQGEEQELRDIAQKHELRQFAGMEQEKPPKGVQPTFTKERKAELREEHAAATRKATEKVIEGDIPIAQAIAQGHSADAIIKDAYDIAYQKAANAKKPIDMEPYIDWINQKIKKIRGFAPSLSPESEKLIGILEDEKRAFMEKNPAFKSKPSQILDAHGKPIPSPHVPEHIPKKVESRKILNQNIEHNKRTEAIYRKNEYSGVEEEVKNLVGEMKSKLADTMKIGGQTDTADAFTAANKLFGQKAKMESIYHILEPGLQDPQKLQKILASKQGQKLKQYMSPKALGEVNAIAKYAQKAEEKIFDRIKTVPGFFDDVKNLGAIAAVTVFGSKVASLKILKESAAKARGLLMTRDGTRKDLYDFMKAAQTGSVNAMKITGARLDESVKKEFGSIDEFERLMNDESFKK